MNIRTAFRTTRKLLERAYNDSRVAMQADAGFDGGEFSSVYHDIILERTENAIYSAVSAKFSIDVNDLKNLICHWYHIPTYVGRDATFVERLNKLSNSYHSD